MWIHTLQCFRTKLPDRTGQIVKMYLYYKCVYFVISYVEIYWRHRLVHWQKYNLLKVNTQTKPKTKMESLWHSWESRQSIIVLYKTWWWLVLNPCALMLEAIALPTVPAFFFFRKPHYLHSTDCLSDLNLRNERF